MLRQVDHDLQRCRSPFQAALQSAKKMDAEDPFGYLCDLFLVPQDTAYFATHCLGLAPKSVTQNIAREITAWGKYGFRSYFSGPHTWLDYPFPLKEMLSKIVGAKPLEVAIMNSLSVNLHLLMSSFYRPEGARRKILMEDQVFQSDDFVIQSQIRRHGLNPSDCILRVEADPATGLLHLDKILAAIEEHGDLIALIFLGSPSFKTGQVLDIQTITEFGHQKGCIVGFDVAHGVGNIVLKLHDWQVDFAVWSSYKYLNGGPGCIGGCFVHERYAYDPTLFRLEAWWGSKLEKRFHMNDSPQFDPTPGADGWQMSAPSILALAALYSSLEIFDRVGMEALCNKSSQLYSFLDELLTPLSKIRYLTPMRPSERGSQLSLIVEQGAEALQQTLLDHRIITGSHSEGLVRLSVSPFYNRFSEVYLLAEQLLMFDRINEKGA
jgi:kynureninase